MAGLLTEWNTRTTVDQQPVSASSLERTLVQFSSPLPSIALPRLTSRDDVLRAAAEADSFAAITAQIDLSSRYWQEHLEPFGSHVYFVPLALGPLAVDLAESNHGLRQLALPGRLVDGNGVQALATLTNLTTLDLWDNEIGNNGAQALATLTNLTNLNLTNNEIGDNGAQALATLANLTNLNLTYNGVGTNGAQALATLTNLTTLNLANNEIGADGVQALAPLTNLTALNLDNNGIGADGPQAFAALTNLTALNLANNRIGNHGAQALANLTNLTNLNLDNNGIAADGAQALATLSNLTNLNLTNNKIAADGAQALATLTNLTNLNLTNNKIAADGAQALATLTNLTNLNLTNNKIAADGAQALATLTNLTNLNLTNNKIAADGAQALATLTNLTNLNLTNNRIGDNGAQALATLTNLTDLTLWDNEIGDNGAQALAALTNLTTLDLASNGIGDDGAQVLATLTKLTTLTLANNRIGADGAQALAALTNLTTLTLANNRIGADGAQALAALTNLTTLNLTNNGVASIRPLLPHLERGLGITTGSYGWGLLVGGNPASEPPPEIVEQGREAVINYFAELDGGDAQLFEAKVLLVGEGRAGKTSLLTRLYLRETEDLPAEKATTRGIDIHRQSFTLPTGEGFWLNVWDFAGQEIYHATHQFFLTKRSLYVLLDDTARDDATVHDPAFKYWLEAVEVLAEKSPVLIFQNEKGGRSKTLAIEGIKGRFANVIDVYGGDLNDRSSADEIRVAVEHQAARLNHVGSKIPAKWVKIRADIGELARANPIVEESEYLRIYEAHLPANADKARHLSEYLHDLGVFLHFQDHELLSRVVVLQNDWATDAVFAVVNDELVKQHDGRFTRADFDRIWSEDRYRNHHPELIALLERFEFCYRLTGSGEWLAPELLPAEKPSSLSGWSAAGDLSVVYRYDFLPKGLVSRLIVREHRLLDDLGNAWRTGTLLTKGATALLVEISPSGNDIVLRARGPERKELLSRVASDLDELNGTYGNLRADRHVNLLIPCICELCAAEIDPHYFERETLIRQRDTPSAPPTARCNRSFDEVSILELLNGIRLGHFDEDQAPSRGDVHIHGEVGQVFTGDRPTSTVDHLEVAPQHSSLPPVEKVDSWNRIAVLAAVSAATIAALLVFVQSNWWRFALTSILGAGLLGGLFVLGMNPKRFYRRLLGGWISIGVMANMTGFFVDGVITRNDARVRFSFGADVAWWWWLFWAVVAVALICADLITQKDVIIDLRDSPDHDASALHTEQSRATRSG